MILLQVPFPLFKIKERRTEEISTLVENTGQKIDKNYVLP